MSAPGGRGQRAPRKMFWFVLDGTGEEFNIALGWAEGWK
jgi:hypothetical protein